MASDVTCKQSSDERLLTNLELNTIVGVRAQGKNSEGKCVYNVLGTDYNILGTMHVHEQEESVEFMDNSDNVLYSAEGGLFCSDENMALWGFDQNGTKFKIARLYHTWIKYFPNGSACESSELDIVHSPEFSVTNKKILVKNSCGDVVTEFEQKSSSVVTVFTVPTWSGIVRSIMIMYSLKIYYSVYQLHLNPMPQNILKELPIAQRSSNISLECILENVKQLRLRAAFRDKKGERLFTDILDGCSGNIKMVAEESTQCQSSNVDIRDEFGYLQLHCSFGTEDVATTIRVYNSCEKLIGIIRKDEDIGCFVILDAIQDKPCYLIRVKTSPFILFQVAHVCLPDQIVAQIYEDRYSVIVNMNGATIESQQKALLLVFAHLQSFKLLENKQPYPPAVDNYPYRISSV